MRQQWFSVACCPTNLARTLASLGQYIYAADDSTLFINQFISSEVSAGPGHPFNLSMTADLTGKGQIVINTDAPANLCLRIPRYADNPVFLFNGEIIEAPVKKGYACLELKTLGELVMETLKEVRGEHE